MTQILDITFISLAQIRVFILFIFVPILLGPIINQKGINYTTNFLDREELLLLEFVSFHTTILYKILHFMNTTNLYITNNLLKKFIYFYLFFH